MNLGNEYQNFVIFIALLIADNEGWKQQTFDSSYQIYSRRRSWTIKLTVLVGTKINFVNAKFEKNIFVKDGELDTECVQLMRMLW